MTRAALVTETRTIPLTQGKAAVVDAEDFESLSRYKWAYHSNGYAYRSERKNGKTVSVLMHRVVAGTPDDLITDHINGDKLDNRRANLRACTYTQNLGNASLRSNNTTGYKGVTWDKSRGRWRARVNVDGREYHLGRFETRDEAVRAYDARARELFGEYAKTNL